MTCQTCGGSGFVRWRLVRLVLVSCDVCHGRGEVPDPVVPNWCADCGEPAVVETPDQWYCQACFDKLAAPAPLALPPAPPMKRYRVEVTETVTRTFWKTFEAESEHDAIVAARDEFWNDSLAHTDWNEDDEDDASIDHDIEGILEVGDDDGDTP